MRWFHLLAVLATPHRWVDVGVGRVTPVVVLVVPSVKVDQQFALFHVLDGRYTYHAGIVLVFGLNSHPRSEQQTPRSS